MFYLERREWAQQSSNLLKIPKGLMMNLVSLNYFIHTVGHNSPNLSHAEYSLLFQEVPSQLRIAELDLSCIWYQ